jgi:hypothetical protein
MKPTCFLLLRNGWRKNTLKAGDIVTIIANANTVKLADASRVFNAGSSGTPGAPQQ